MTRDGRADEQASDLDIADDGVGDQDIGDATLFDEHLGLAQLGAGEPDRTRGKLHPSDVRTLVRLGMWS